MENRAWSKAQCLVPRAHLEAPIAWVLEGDCLRVAFTEDGRSTGWGLKGEWFDADSEIVVGQMLHIFPETAAPQYDLRPYAIAHRPAPGLENPPLSNRDGEGVIHAVGQTHTHTNLSVCCRSADRDQHLNYRFMQDVQHSDFGATTDHAYNMWHTEMLQVNKLAAYYYFPGEFVAFPAYEWTGSGSKHEGGPWGHVNPLYLEEDGELEFHTPVDPSCAGGSLPRLWQAYAGRRIVTPPHHVADNIHSYNWQVYDPRFVPVIELFQDMRGSGEQPWVAGVTNFLHQEEGHWAVPELLAGKRFGFIGGADHTGVARAGVLLTDLTRSALYEALMARRTFATTGIALQLAFTANGQMMGSQVEAAQIEFRLVVRAPETIAELQVVRNGATVDTLPVDSLEATHRWQVERRQVGEFWFCRILLVNGEMAWTSPIWLG